MEEKIIEQETKTEQTNDFNQVFDKYNSQIKNEINQAIKAMNEELTTKFQNVYSLLENKAKELENEAKVIEPLNVFKK